MADWRSKFEWSKFLKPLNDKEKAPLDGRFDVTGETLTPFQWPARNPKNCLSVKIESDLKVQHHTVQKTKYAQTGQINEQVKSLLDPNLAREYDSQSQEQDMPGTSRRRLFDDSSADQDASVLHHTKRVRQMQQSEDDDESADKDLEDSPGVAVMAKLHEFKSRISQTRSDRESPASKWNLAKLKNYITADDIDLTANMASDVRQSTTEFRGDKAAALKSSMSRISRRLLQEDQRFVEKDDGLKLWTLQFRPSNEQVICYIVEEVLGSVCQELGVMLKPEEIIKKQDSFPNARMDFGLGYGRMLFGAVEVKQPSKLKPPVIGQFLCSLLKLQHTHQDDRLQYVGILTDGYRYLFVTLTGKKFTFEFDQLFPHPTIKIRKAVTWSDLFEICTAIGSIIKSAIATFKR